MKIAFTCTLPLSLVELQILIEFPGNATDSHSRAITFARGERMRESGVYYLELLCEIIFFNKKETAPKFSGVIPLYYFLNNLIGVFCY